MGTFMHVGLRVALSVRKEQVEGQEDWFRRELDNVVDVSIYDEQETTDRYTWTLQPALIQQELVPFLEKQLKLADKDELEQTDTLLAELLTIQSAEELKKWCDNADQWQFNWLGNDYITVRTNHKWIDVASPAFTFLSAGKILFEETGSLIDYLERTIVRANPEFQLAKAVCITIY